jgi:hypothetical protein
MTNADDLVKIKGSFITQSSESHSGYLIAGTLEIGGDLTQVGANAESFCTYQNHITVLNGDKAQNVTMKYNQYRNHNIGKLKIENTSDIGVAFVNRTIVSSIYDTNSILIGLENLIVNGTNPFPDNKAWFSLPP